MPDASSPITTQKTWVSPPPLGSEISARADEVEDALEALIEVSEIEDTFEGRESIIGFNPWKWSRLADEHISVLQAARAATERWLNDATRIIRINAPEFLADFEGETPVLTSVVDRSRQSEGPISGDKERAVQSVREALQGQREALRHAGSPLRNLRSSSSFRTQTPFTQIPRSKSGRPRRRPLSSSFRSFSANWTNTSHITRTPRHGRRQSASSDVSKSSDDEATPSKESRSVATSGSRKSRSTLTRPRSGSEPRTTTIGCSRAPCSCNGKRPAPGSCW